MENFICETSMAERPTGTVKVQKLNAYTGELIEEIDLSNRLVLRYHVVLSHILSPVGNLSNNLSGQALIQLGIPSQSDLLITKMRFGTDTSTTQVTMSGLIAMVKPGFNADGTANPTLDNYPIDTYQFTNGLPVNGIPDYDATITFQATMAGPQGNSNTVNPILYGEAGLFTANDIMFARVQLPSLTKTQSFAYKFAWSLRWP